MRRDDFTSVKTITLLLWCAILSCLVLEEDTILKTEVLYFSKILLPMY
jgi:hypothetical protein